MAMEINNIYGSNANSYVGFANSMKQNTEGEADSKTRTTSTGTGNGAVASETKTEAGRKSEGTKEGVSQRKTAMDELAYLSDKYSNYSFVAANYTKGMRYGSNATVNVAIAPQFLAKMANDPELEKEYEGYFADMQELDAQEDCLQAAKGWHVVARGWAIDKDGGISKWGIVEKDNRKSHLQTMSENAEKIRKQNEEKKKEKAEMEERRKIRREEKTELEEKMQEAGKTQFGDKWKGIIVIDKDDENMAVSKSDKDNAEATGLHMNLKV
ncbi:MAG: DUF6033 family protein [Bacteroides sp.]|nr:DUF6033 family protein [Bacteroides sp.]MCM1549142.1 DUF6033 family protein [Clostridium sp.]